MTTVALGCESDEAPTPAADAPEQSVAASPVPAAPPRADQPADAPAAAKPTPEAKAEAPDPLADLSAADLKKVLKASGYRVTGTPNVDKNTVAVTFQKGRHVGAIMIYSNTSSAAELIKETKDDSGIAAGDRRVVVVRLPGQAEARRALLTKISEAAKTG